MEDSKMLRQVLDGTGLGAAPPPPPEWSLHEEPWPEGSEEAGPWERGTRGAQEGAIT